MREWKRQKGRKAERQKDRKAGSAGAERLSHMMTEKSVVKQRQGLPFGGQSLSDKGGDAYDYIFGAVSARDFNREYYYSLRYVNTQKVR